MGVGLLLYPVRGISASTTMPYRYTCYYIRARDLSTETFTLRLAIRFGYDLVFFSFPKADLRKPGLRDLSMGIFGTIVVDSFPVRLLSSTMDAARCSIQQYLKGKAIDSTDCMRLLGYNPYLPPGGLDTLATFWPRVSSQTHKWHPISKHSATSPRVRNPQNFLFADRVYNT